MKLFAALAVCLFAISCSTQTGNQDGFTRFKAASDIGESCGSYLKKIPSQDGATWSDSSRQSVEFAFNYCLTEYSALKTHASSLEFLKAVFTKLGIAHEQTTSKDSSRLIAYSDKDTSKETILMVHSTDLVNSQMVGEDGKSAYLWGQQTMDVKAIGIMQVLAMVFVQKSKTPMAKNLVFVATENGQFHDALDKFPHAEVILNEGGYGFSKQNKDVFLIGSEQKGGAWLKLKHKSPNRLLSHLDQLMAVFLPHDPQDFREPGKCQLLSFSTLEQKVNTIPYKVDLQLSCRGVPDLQVGQAFAHQDVSYVGRKIEGVYHVSLELAYPKENNLGRLSALQVAAQGLQKLSVIPYRDWSFEEPKFYQHVRTPASADFVKTVKDVYSEQSPWGDLLWELDGSGNWSQSSVAPDKRDGPEKMFRTACSWTGFDSSSEGAEAYVDCRLIHTGFMKNTTQPQAELFIKQLREKAHDPQLQVELIKGWDYVASNPKSEFVQIMKQEIQKEYPQAHTSTWLAPASLALETKEAQKIPSYGFFPVLKDDFLDASSDKSFPAQQAFTANKIYSGTIARLVK